MTAIEFAKASYEDGGDPVARLWCTARRAATNLETGRRVIRRFWQLETIDGNDAYVVTDGIIEHLDSLGYRDAVVTFEGTFED